MKKILITGARSGIALSVINKLKDKDYYIYATCHTKKEANALNEKFEDYDNIECIKLDVNDDNDLKLIDKIDIDILLCNAAISNGGNLLEIDMDKFIENYEVNVFSNLKLIQRVLNKKIKSECKIIIMSSLAGIIPIKFIGAYSSSKASLIKIAETLKMEFQMINPNIKICLIEPGLYKTGFNEYMFMNKYDGDDTAFKDVLDKIEFEESIILDVLSHNNLDSITKKIIESISSSNPKFIYRAPLRDVIVAKLYSLFKE